MVEEAAGPEKWAEWVRYLSQRATATSLRQVVRAGRSSPLLWSSPDNVKDGRSDRLIRHLDRLARPAKGVNGRLARELEDWLEASRRRPSDPQFSLECLAWSHAMPLLAQSLPAAPWFELLEELVDIARRSAGIELLRHPLAQQLLAGELPLTLAYVFPEIGRCRQLAPEARLTLSFGIIQLLDGEGLPGGRHLSLMRPLLACWTRCGWLARAMGQSCFDEQGEAQYKYLARQALRLTRYDGSAVLTGDAAGDWSKNLFDAVLALVGDEEDLAIADQALPGGKTGRTKIAGVPLPEPSVHSEWAGVAMLRRNWRRGTDHLTVNYGGRAVHCELNCGPETVWSGPWDLQIKADGEPLTARGDWEEICWESDKDVDYLELELVLAGPWKLQRQMLLARDDRFLFLADALLGEGNCQIEYRSVLPLSAAVRFQMVPETREGMLVGKRRLGLVLPLALPEWRAEPAVGSLDRTAKGLELFQRTRCPRLFAPLFIDLEPRRMRRPLTWRQLTVAEDLKTQPADVAAGYRVQLGDRQWLIYRSLGARGNRTVLGQNFSTEFVMARFSRDGKAEKLLEIE